MKLAIIVATLCLASCAVDESNSVSVIEEPAEKVTTQSQGQAMTRTVQNQTSAPSQGKKVSQAQMSTKEGATFRSLLGSSQKPQ